MRCVKMNRTGEASRSTKRRCCHLWGPKALQRHPFPGVRFGPKDRHCNITLSSACGLGAVR
jgi:hypothetical protein